MCQNNSGTVVSDLNCDSSARPMGLNMVNDCPATALCAGGTQGTGGGMSPKREKI